MAEIEENYTLSDMTNTLAQLFRYSVGDERLNIVPLKKEIEMMMNYIKIQNIRYDNKINICIEIPETLMDAMIIKLTVQPLIENAIKHGLEFHEGLGTIKVEARKQADHMEVTVSDDGNGISAEVLTVIQQQLNHESFLMNSHNEAIHIGLYNVHRRLKLYYGPQYGLTITSTVRQGTTVKFVVPLKNQNGTPFEIMNPYDSIGNLI